MTEDNPKTGLPPDKDNKNIDNQNMEVDGNSTAGTVPPPAAGAAPKSFTDIAKSYAEKSKTEVYKTPDDYTTAVELTRTYILKEVLNEGYKVWVRHKFPNVRMAVISKMFIEGNYRPVLQLLWEKDEINMQTKDAIDKEYEEAAEIQIEFGKWRVRVKAEHKDNLDMFGGIKPTIAKAIVIYGYQYNWTKKNGTELLKQLLSDFAVFTDDAKIQLIEEDKMFFGTVSLPVKEFKKIPVGAVEIPMIAYNEDESKWEGSKKSTGQFKVKVIGVDRTKKLPFVKPPIRCNKCSSLNHVIKDCPQMRHSRKLFYCSSCGQKGTCTFVECENKDNLKNGIFSNPEPKQTETLVSDPFTQQPKKSWSKKGQKNSQQAPKQGATEQFPDLQNKDPKPGSFYQPTAEQKKRSEIPGIKKNRPKKTGKATKRSNPDAAEEQQVKTSNRFGAMPGMADTNLDLNRDGLTVLGDGYNQAQNSQNDKVILAHETPRASHEHIQHSDREKMEIPKPNEESESEDEPKTRTGINNPDGTTDEGSRSMDSESDSDSVVLEDDDNYENDGVAHFVGETEPIDEMGSESGDGKGSGSLSQPEHLTATDGNSSSTSKKDDGADMGSNSATKEVEEVENPAAKNKNKKKKNRKSRKQSSK